MGRHPAAPRTRLGQLLQQHRGARTGAQAANDLGLTTGTYYRLEREDRALQVDVARKLARGLGMTLEAVCDASEQPAIDEMTADEVG